MNTFKVGDKVRFTDNYLHEHYPSLFPEAGTIWSCSGTSTPCTGTCWLLWPIRQARMMRAGCDTTSTWRVTWLLSAI